MRKYFSIILMTTLGVFLFSVQSVFSQKSLTGNISSDDGPLPGATIIVKGTNAGTTSDFDGNFSIIASDDDILLISYVGYKTQEIEVDNQESFSILLAADTELEEVVLTGYGVIKKSDVTGSMSSLGDEDFNIGNVTSVDQLMQGRVSGVQINSFDGEPGAGLSVNIRGSSSITASNQPLYVIDGLIIDNTPSLSPSALAADNRNEAAKNPLNTLNPNDIESIDILKDASATALYGARAANGVVLITTKRGEPGETNITYSTTYGTQSIANKIEVLNAQEYMQVFNGISQDLGNGIIFSESDKALIGNGTNWQDQVFRDGLLKEHNLSVSGGSGNGNTRYYASLNYSDHEGVVKNTDLQKYIARLNLSQKIGEKFSVDLNMTVSRLDDNPSLETSRNNEVAGTVNTSMLYDPTAPIFNDPITNPLVPYYNSTLFNINNPVAVLEANTKSAITNRIMTNVNLNWDVIEGLSTKINAGTDITNVRADAHLNTYTSTGFSRNEIAGISTLSGINNLFEWTVTYDKQFNDIHSVNVLGGVTYQDFSRMTTQIRAEDFAAKGTYTNNVGLGNGEKNFVASDKIVSSLFSYIGRINYSFADKLLVTATLRRDGSSKFGLNNKWGTFPAFALGYKLDEESFVSELFNQLKVRASWGQVGNEAVAIAASQQTYGSGGNATFNNSPYTAIAPSRVANPDLKWETSEQTNIGIDFGILANRISGSIDYFVKDTKDLLLDLPLPTSSGFASVLQNVGSVKNSGIELLISGGIIKTQDLSWETTFNFTTTKNEVTDIGGLGEISTGNIEAIGTTGVIKPGWSLNEYYGYEMNGLLQNAGEVAASATPNSKPGAPKWIDHSPDGTINAADRVSLGSQFPDYTYGLNNVVRYKDWTLNVFIYGQEGKYLLNVNALESLYPLNYRRNLFKLHGLNRWTPTNTDTKWPSGVLTSSYGGGKVNNLSVEDASFMRLKTVSVSYNVPVDNINFLKSLQLGLIGDNLLTVTDYTGWDPESNRLSSGNFSADISSYPTARSIILSLTASF
ncbi:MAG: TonB-dependent receptor [Flavobacteriaceae bacterium]|nr:TonB-dependent receptor [Flavobacteriaceae bacterium]